MKMQKASINLVTSVWQSRCMYVILQPTQVRFSRYFKFLISSNISRHVRILIKSDKNKTLYMNRHIN